jgi:hypothetical protein
MFGFTDIGHVCGLVHQLMLKCADSGGLSAKHQRRILKYQTRVEECGQDIRALDRFVDAQVTAFRKTLKKYKKWTGSTTLGGRFKENVLDNPKSFTHSDFEPLQLQYRELRTALEVASPVRTVISESPLPTESRDQFGHQIRRGSRRSSHSITATTPPTYWNEYEHGSEADDQDDAYVIYIDPDADDRFPGLAYMKNVFGAPVDHVRHWLQSQKSKGAAAASPSETQSLLGRRYSRAATPPADYFTTGGQHTAAPMTYHEPTTEDEYVSSDEGETYHSRGLCFFPAHSYSSSSSLVGVEAKMGRYYDKALTTRIMLAFIVAFVLLGVSCLLVVTGRRRLRLEVDAGATVGSVASLFCACMGIGGMLYRQYPAGYLYSLAVWGAFVIVCVLNGILLVLIASSSGF